MLAQMALNGGPARLGSWVELLLLPAALPCLSAESRFQRKSKWQQLAP